MSRISVHKRVSWHFAWHHMSLAAHLHLNIASSWQSHNGTSSCAQNHAAGRPQKLFARVFCFAILKPYRFKGRRRPSHRFKTFQGKG